MAFDIDTWKEAFQEHLPGFRKRMKRAGVDSVYAALSAAALWPMIETAQRGDWSAAVALTGLTAASLGTSLLASRIKDWKDETDAIRQISKVVEQDPALCAELDLVLQKLDAIAAVGNTLSRADRAWFTETLGNELKTLGSSLSVAGNVNGTIIQGNGNQVSLNGIGNVIGPGSTHVELHFSLFTVIHTDGTSTRMEFNPSHAADVPNIFAPHPGATLPELQHLIGHKDELRRLLQLYDRASREGKGAIVFLSGRTGYGAKALGRTFVQAVRQGKGAAVVTRFWAEEIEENTRRDPRWRSRYDDETCAELLVYAPSFLTQPALAPFWGLVFQFCQQYPGTERKQLPTSAENLPAYFRDFGRPGKPLVVLLEDFEHAAPLWRELLRYLAPELARGLPILFIVSMHAQSLADQIPPDAQTPAEALALELAHKDLAELYHLGRVERQDLADYIAPAHADVAEHLQRLSGGLPLLAQNLWREWQRSKDVVADDEGRWRMAPGSPWRAFGSGRDYVRQALKRLWDEDEAPRWPAERMLEILTLAACEGETFTPEALAFACDVKLDDLFYSLESLLEEPDDPGLVKEAAPVKLRLQEAQWEKALERFEFSPAIVWLALQDEPPAASLLEKLAEGLRRAYWPFAERCALTMARLYTQAGNEAQAAASRKLIPGADPAQTLMAQAELLLEMVGDPPGDLALSRLWQLAIALYNVYVGYNHPHWAQDFYARLLLLAETSGWQPFQADVLYFLGQVARALGEYPAAREHYRRALEIDEELGRKDGIAANLAGLGQVARALGEYSAAQGYYQRALVIHEELGRKDGIAVDLTGLGQVARVLGEYPAAREHFQRALEIFREIGQEHFAAEISNRLANLPDANA